MMTVFGRALSVALLVTASAAPTLAACPDCDGDGTVAINELITVVGIALGEAPLEACSAADRNGDGLVSIDEVIAAINAALDGCPAAPTATATPTPVASTPAPVPTDAAALHAWLLAGNYLGWAAESAPHRSTGPHGGSVRTYVNPTLFDSLSAGAAAHPQGAVAVKELYFNNPGGPIAEWAVMVKLQDDSDGGRGWYWYEGEGLAGVGLGICTGCHSAGRDLVRIPFPLQ